MWLILIIVILFMGFPNIFITLMTALHFPMLGLLVGIVVRGSVFAFRHYDPIQDKKTQKIYTFIFGLSSLWTSIWLGILLASLNRGLIQVEPANFYTAYIQPWWGLFPFTMGLFVAAIFAFLASIYLTGETEDIALKKYFIQRAFGFNVAIVILGGLVFVTSYLEDGPLFNQFFSHPLAVACMFIATLLYFVLWFIIQKRNTFWVRVISAGQMTLILAGWLLIYAPNALITSDGPLSFYEAAAPTATLWQLTLALLVGSVFIFPSLFYLFKVFKMKSLT